MQHTLLPAWHAVKQCGLARGQTIRPGASYNPHSQAGSGRAPCRRHQLLHRFPLQHLYPVLIGPAVDPNGQGQERLLHLDREVAWGQAQAGGAVSMIRRAVAGSWSDDCGG